MSELPPGPSEIACTVEVGQSGKFMSQLHLYVDDQGLREIIFYVSGEVKPSSN